MCAVYAGNSRPEQINAGRCAYIFISQQGILRGGYIYPYTFDPENASVYGYYTDGPINLEALLTASTALLMRTFVEVLENTETGITMKMLGFESVK